MIHNRDQAERWRDGNSAPLCPECGEATLERNHILDIAYVQQVIAEWSALGATGVAFFFCPYCFRQITYQARMAVTRVPSPEGSHTGSPGSDPTRKQEG
jgi:predicted RNA-binding Zn-ribbon protein involved in translation (DUF1610 family)